MIYLKTCKLIDTLGWGMLSYCINCKVATTSFSFITQHSTRKIRKKILPGEDVSVNKYPIFFTSDNTHHLCAMQTECIEMDDLHTSHNFDNIFITPACDGSAINAYIVLTLFYKKRTTTPDSSRFR